MPKDDLKPVPITPELLRNYERFVEIGIKYKTRRERKKAIGDLLRQIAAEKEATNN